MCDAGRRMYARNLVAATDGNLSAKLDDDRFLCTPSGCSVGHMKPSDIVIANGRGEKLEGEQKVSSEFFTHLAAYEERPDISAIAHAHPPNAVAFTLAGLSMEEYLLPELVAALGGVPTADYATPGTKEGAEVVRELIRDCDALLLDRHGALTVGKSVIEAYYRLEKIEHAAETIIRARMIGEIAPLDASQLERLFKAGEAYGSGGKVFRGRNDSAG